MGLAADFQNELLIIPFLTSPEIAKEVVVGELVSRFGETDYLSPPIEFGYTDYYRAEMGENLTRHIVSFEHLVAPTSLPDIKRYTNELEQRFSRDGLRRVNLDPGLLSLERLILASTKNNGRRIPLRDGIYAEITLIFHHGDFHPVEWTYPDYASSEYREVFRRLRLDLRQKLKHEAT